MDFEKKDKYVLVTAKGLRSDLLSVVEATEKVYAVIEETKTFHILADYRKMKFDLHHSDMFNIVRYYEGKLPMLKKASVAAIVNYDSIPLAKSWEEIAHSRGFNFKIFSDIKEGEEWLLQQA